MISRTSKSSAMEKIMVSHVIKKIGFHSFKIEKLYGEAVRNLYLDLKRKYSNL